MAPVTFEQGIALDRTSENTFRSLQTPWTWPNSTVVPGGLLMALAANAAYQTTAEDFALDTLQCHFLAAPKFDVPFDTTVQRLTDGGRFCSRIAQLYQGGSLKFHVTCSFVRPRLMGGPSMTHSIQRQSDQTIDAITLDDLARERKEIGPYVKFQRLPLVYNKPGPVPKHPAPESLVYTSVGQVSPPIATEDARMHSLAIVFLSDYHILDCPPTVHGHTFALPRINDRSQAVPESDFSFSTSLNHTIRFHAQRGYRADELVYVEAMCPWTEGRRAEVDSRLFSPKGRLLATCTQEVYFVMKEEGERSASRQWVMEKEEIVRGKL